MGLWDEGNPGLLSGRKKNKSRGGVPALGFDPHHLRRTEERKSVLEGPAWTPRWSQNHSKINWFSGPKLEQTQMSCQKALCILRKEEASYFVFGEKREASHICLPQRNKLFIKRNCKGIVWGKHGSTCKTHFKVVIYMKTWNDPTVITDILPQTKALCILRKEEASYFIFSRKKKLLISVSFRGINCL